MLRVVGLGLPWQTLLPHQERSRVPGGVGDRVRPNAVPSQSPLESVRDAVLIKVGSSWTGTMSHDQGPSPVPVSPQDLGKLI